MPEISVILPSVRPDGVAKRVREFALANSGVDYELLVISTFPVAGERVVHIPEGERTGTVRPCNLAYAQARGQYIVLWSDDVVPGKDCLRQMLAFVKRRPAPFIGAFRFKTRRGLMGGQHAAYGKMFACFGCASRATLEAIGGLFDPALHCHFPDVDMGLRVWAQGGSVAVCPDAWILWDGDKDGTFSENMDKYFAADSAVFLERWHPRMGHGTPPDLRTILGPVPLGLWSTLRYRVYTAWCPAIVKRWLKRGDERKISVLFAGGRML